MASALVFLIVFGIVAAFWSAHRAAAEAALRIGRNACAAADVQWLDQSVQLAGMRLRRHPSGWIGIERSYHFDYSRAGDDRHRGRIVMLGSELREFVGPGRGDAEPLAFPRAG
ncbi:DUF3301 domain-containing protein [Coralloluteibacterium thermophilus]|uniref:DUF3301 domain-containing protein n=1 Tax=Coralloluteibacterium thermophilum TaxID=2707049 RepID=A0ABV9NKF8_9GAMM